MRKGNLKKGVITATSEDMSKEFAFPFPPCFTKALIMTSVLVLDQIIHAFVCVLPIDESRGNVKNPSEGLVLETV